MDVRERKSQLREDIRRRLAVLMPKERAAESRSLCRRILELLPEGSLTVAAFSSLKGEPDLSLLLREFLKREVSLFLPRVESGKIVFRRVKDLRTLQTGAFNILEPPESAELLDPVTLHTALVPGVAFDRAGNRLGRGNGGYDHWIRAQRQASLDPSDSSAEAGGLGMTKTKFWGICFECQLVQEVPTEAHDEKMDAVVTARGMTGYWPVKPRGT